MKGEITFTQDFIREYAGKKNYHKSVQITLFKLELDRIFNGEVNIPPGTGWYALKEDKEFVRFKWCTPNHRSWDKDDPYVKRSDAMLKKNGWIIG